MKNYSDELNTIIAKLQKQGKMNFVPKATETLISAFEERNGITLPTKYKEWLLFSDGGDLFLPAGVQLYGVDSNPLIEVNDNYIQIGALSTGDSVFCEKSGERILIYNQEEGRIEEDETFVDFFDFLNNLGKTLGV